MSYVAMTKCVFCGKTKNEIALDRRLNDKAFPDLSQPIVVDFNPCDECASNWAQGVALIGTEPYDVNKHGRIPKKARISATNKPNGLVPTGGYLVIDERAGICKQFEKIVGGKVKKGSKLFVEQELLVALSKMQKEHDEKEDTNANS